MSAPTRSGRGRSGRGRSGKRSLFVYPHPLVVGRKEGSTKASSPRSDVARFRGGGRVGSAAKGRLWVGVIHSRYHRGRHGGRCGDVGGCVVSTTISIGDARPSVGGRSVVPARSFWREPLRFRGGRGLYGRCRPRDQAGCLSRPSTWRRRGDEGRVRRSDGRSERWRRWRGGVRRVTPSLRVWVSWTGTARRGGSRRSFGAGLGARPDPPTGP